MIEQVGAEAFAIENLATRKTEAEVKLGKLVGQDKTGTSTDNEISNDIQEKQRNLEILAQTTLELLGLPNGQCQFLIDGRFLGQAHLAKIWPDSSHENEFNYIVVKATPFSDTNASQWQRQANTCTKLSGVESFISTIKTGVTADKKTGVILMEYFNGVPLKQWIYEKKQAKNLASKPQLVKISQLIASSLNAAHEQGVAHGDVSRNNFMLPLNFSLANPQLKGIDFDNSPQVVEDGETKYTTPYYPPERVTGWKDGLADDVYSLGILLRFIFAKTLPFYFKVVYPDGRRHVVNLEDGKGNVIKGLYRHWLEKLNSGEIEEFSLIELTTSQLLCSKMTTEELAALNQLIADMTQKLPEDRITMAQVVQRLEQIFANRAID